MNPNLISGDYILAIKTIPGIRIFHFTKSSNGDNIKIKRLSIKKIKRNDIIVFNYPYSKSWKQIQFDLTKYYIKRCIGIPGDTLSIKNGYYYINNIHIPLGNIKGQEELSMCSQEYLKQRRLFYSYPEDSMINWSIKDFGPLYIPRKGDKIKMNRTNAILYQKLIKWEQQASLSINTLNNVFLNKNLIHNYQFKKSYYFVAGDLVLDSQDSRYWGLLPEDYITGKAWIIWKSVDPYTSKFRWERFLKIIH